LTIDSLAFTGIYGLHTDKVQQTVKVKKMEEYGTILLNIKGAAPNAIAELLDASGNVLRQQPVTVEGTADFYFLNPRVRNIIYVCLTTVMIMEYGIQEIMIRRFSPKKFFISRRYGR